jgi:hypothetical protein
MFSKLNELMQINVRCMERVPVVSNNVSRQFQISCIHLSELIKAFSASGVSLIAMLVRHSLAIVPRVGGLIPSRTCHKYSFRCFINEV